MADILVKNMEMPKSCLGELNGKNDCPIVGICGIFKATSFKEKENIVWEQRLKDCPLVEVPPHGRLKDVDEILERNVMYTPIGRVVYPFDIDSAPTVIEATKERGDNAGL